MKYSIKRILKFDKKLESEPARTCWALHEIIRIMEHFPTNKQERSIDIVENIINCLRLIICLFFPKSFLKEVPEEDYFLSGKNVNEWMIKVPTFKKILMAEISLDNGKESADFKEY